MLKSKKVLTVNVLLIMALVMIGFMVLPQDKVYADDNSNPPMLRWVYEQYACHCKENYTIIDSVPNYCSNNKSVIYNKVQVIGYGDDGDTVEELTHYGTLDGAKSADRNADGTVVLRFVDVIPRSGNYYLSNDSRKLSSLPDDIKVDKGTKIGYGRVLVKEKLDTSSSWGGWKDYDLSDFVSKTHTFEPGRRVVIVILYELKENIFVHHNIRIQYGFHVSQER